ncbi:hypothetical protein GQ53DRAFT_528917 [Thozetella sp. PMI_491]|nr:hypothetical protein GQ53DRAFT_528917 [Thozetella sp. PMI_491]
MLKFLRRLLSPAVPEHVQIVWLARDALEESSLAHQLVARFFNASAISRPSDKRACTKCRFSRRHTQAAASRSRAGPNEQSILFSNVVSSDQPWLSPPLDLAVCRICFFRTPTYASGQHPGIETSPTCPNEARHHSVLPGSGPYCCRDWTQILRKLDHFPANGRRAVRQQPVANSPHATEIVAFLDMPPCLCRDLDHHQSHSFKSNVNRQ